MNRPSQENILSDLNPAQKEAVTHGEGPQLVVAGAGTGKTAVITRRIAYLVASKLCSAKEILALTFTDKAAGEMESRVDLLVPYGFTDSTICTFHAFGDRLLREQGILLGINPSYKVLSASEQLIFMREHLFELPLRRLLPLADPTRHLQLILNVISRAKDEDVSPEAYIHYCRELSARPGTPTEAESACLEKQLEIALTYEKYQRLLIKKGLSDFGDLIMQTLKLLRNHPDVLADCRRRFRYILVDEFQDTNAAQFELIRLLAGGHGNITVVGDDDQSIYKFRGAAISNIMSFTRIYPDSKITVLIENYRSTQAILDSAYRLIQHNNPDRLEVKKNINKHLHAQADSPGLPVGFQSFDTVSAEADWIAKDIADKKGKENLAWSDFAILIRANRHSDPFLRALNVKGIPFRFSGYQGLYRRPEVKLCIAFLRALADPAAPLPLHELAASSIYRMPAQDLAYLAAESRKRNRSMRAMLSLALAFEESPFTEAGAKCGHKLLSDLATYLELALRLSTGQVLYRFLTESGFLATHTGAATLESDLIIRNLSKFFSVVQRYESIAKSDKVVHFVEHLDMLEEVGDDPTTSEIDPEAEAVNILTVHRAKGLEFPVVYLASLTANRFPSINRTPALSLPDELAKEELPEGDAFLAEERRLFYVAMTRARSQLLLSSARDYGGVRSHKVSRFVLEALDIPKDTFTVWKTSALEKIHAHAPQPEFPLGNIKNAAEPGALTLSYYQIDDFLSCPLKYKYVHLLRIPVLPHHAILYGKALHTAITAYYRMKMTGTVMSEQEIIQIFLDSWVNEGFISREHEELRQETGINALKSFVKNESLTPLFPKYIEKAFMYNLGRDKITGRIDRVDILPNGNAVIIDYKSSDVRDQAEADKKAKESLQLKIYAAAWHHLEQRLPESLQLYFIESGIVGRTVPDMDTLEEVETIVAKVGDGIRQGTFTAKPNAWVCGYCPYKTVCPSAEI